MVPAMRFAGVDLVYALRRIAGESGVIFVMDDIRPLDATEADLGFHRIDVDIPAGTLVDTLEGLRKSVKGDFDYKLDNGLLLVRSLRSVQETTSLDRPILPQATIEVDFRGLVGWLKNNVEAAKLTRGSWRGHPVYKKVTLEVPDGGTIMDLVLQYARKVDYGLRIKRAGYAYKENPAKYVVANSLGMWRTLSKPRPLTRHRMNGSLLWRLAEASDRTGTPLCIVDRSVLFDQRAALDYTKRIVLQEELTMKEAIEVYASGDPLFLYNADDEGLIRIQGSMVNQYFGGRDLLAEPVKAGTFNGTLGELTRWLNANRKKSSTKVLMGGEIPPDAPVTSLEIEDGTTVEDAICQFAKASGQGVVVVIRDAISPKQPLENTWAGAYVTPLREWGPAGDPPLG